jgi:hypothetical protein
LIFPRPDYSAIQARTDCWRKIREIIVEGHEEVKSGQRAGSRRILRFPIPDYSHIPHKVDCWWSNSNIRREENEVPDLDDIVRTRDKKEILPTPVPNLNGEEAPGNTSSMRLVSIPATMVLPAKPQPRDMKGNKNPRDNVESPIHDSDCSSNESEVSTTPKMGGDGKKTKPRKMKGRMRRLFCCC